ncbi:helix-turn-helix domain-containing protein [Streptomyces sp. NPDC055005]
MTSVKSVPGPSSTRRTPALPDPGERKRLREAWKLTPRQVASAFGVTPATVRSWESGHTSPTGKRREAYARFLKGLAQEPRTHRAPAARSGATDPARSGPPAPSRTPAPARPDPAPRPDEARPASRPDDRPRARSSGTTAEARASRGAAAPAPPHHPPVPGARHRPRSAPPAARHPGESDRSAAGRPATPVIVPASARVRVSDRDLGLSATALSAWLLILVLAQAFPSVLAG